MPGSFPSALQRICRFAVPPIGLALTIWFPLASAGQTPEERLELLEAKVKALTERVATLETGPSAGITTDSDDAGVAWQLGSGLSGRPLPPTSSRCN
jgi:hypothetical protein